VIKTSQFIFTRFNAPIGFAKANIGLDGKWLEHRFFFFDNFCVPSVMGQEKKDFHWLILMDERTPELWRARLRRSLAELSGAQVLLAATFSEQIFVDEVKRIAAAEGAERVITSRLDNDDGLSNRYLAKLFKMSLRLSNDRHYVVNFRRGCQLSKLGAFSVRGKLNPFLSMISPLANLKTAFADEHGKMDQHGTLIDNRGILDRSFNWLQLIHGSNAANQLTRKRKPVDPRCLEPFSLSANALNLLQNDNVLIPRSQIHVYAR
jgi:hypothetical protein